MADRMHDDAMERLKQMYSKAQPERNNSKVIDRTVNTSQNNISGQQKMGEEKEKISQAENVVLHTRNSKNLLDVFMADKEKSLLVLLLVILISEKADTTLVLALVYLIL